MTDEELVQRVRSNLRFMDRWRWRCAAVHLIGVIGVLWVLVLWSRFMINGGFPGMGQGFALGLAIGVGVGITMHTAASGLFEMLFGDLRACRLLVRYHDELARLQAPLDGGSAEADRITPQSGPPSPIQPTAVL